MTVTGTVTGTGRAEPAPTPIGGGPGRPGRVQLVALELAVIAVGCAVFANRPVAVLATGIGALAMLAVTLGRSRRRWVYESFAARRRLRRRRHAATLALRRPDGPGPLAALAPGLRVRAVVDRGTAIGVGQDELGWFAAAAVAPWTGLSGDRQATLPLARLARLVADGALPVSTLQVVTHNVPAPSAGLDPRTACASSYRELLGQASALTDQQIWIAVRLGTRDGADAAAERGGGLAGVDRALAAGLARIGTALDSAGFDHRVLDAEGLRQALMVSCGLQRQSGSAPLPTAQPVAGSLADRAPAAERWAFWQAAGALHVCFAIRSWPAAALGPVGSVAPPGSAGPVGSVVPAGSAGSAKPVGSVAPAGPVGPAPGLLAALAQVPLAAAVDTSVSLRAADDGLAVRALVRVVAAPDRIAACVQQLLGNAKRLGVELTRLDGEQAVAAYATAPTGAALGMSPW
jgi:type VII secretion protein EccE